MNEIKNTAKVRTGCNTSLPVDALNVGDVVPGMSIYCAYEVDQTPRTVLKVEKGYGQRVVIVTERGREEGTLAGTVRLVADNYNYHNGCCNKV